jgi:hypothetical protein
MADVRRVAAACAAAVAVAAGCGGDDDGGNGNGGGGTSGSDEAAIRTSIESFFDAIAVKKVDEACSHLSADAREKAAATVPNTDSCEEGMEEILDTVGSRERESLPEEIRKANLVVEVKGDKAEAVAPGRPRAEPIPLVREGGEWKIDHNPLTFNANE